MEKLKIGDKVWTIEEQPYVDTCPICNGANEEKVKIREFTAIVECPLYRRHSEIRTSRYVLSDHLETITGILTEDNNVIKYKISSTSGLGWYDFYTEDRVFKLRKSAQKALEQKNKVSDQKILKDVKDKLAEDVRKFEQK